MIFDTEKLTEWSFPLRLKRDYTISKEKKLLINRQHSKTKIRSWENFSEETIKRLAKIKSLQKINVPLDPEVVEKMKKTKKLKKKYLYKTVPREKTYSGVIFK